MTYRLEITRTVSFTKGDMGALEGAGTKKLPIPPSVEKGMSSTYLKIQEPLRYMGLG